MTTNASWDEAAVTAAELAYGAAEDNDDAEAAIRQLVRAFGVEVGDDDNMYEVGRELNEELGEAALGRVHDAVVNALVAYCENGVESPERKEAGDCPYATLNPIFDFVQNGLCVVHTEKVWDLMDEFVEKRPVYPPEIRHILIDYNMATYSFTVCEDAYFQGISGVMSMLWSSAEPWLYQTDEELFDKFYQFETPNFPGGSEVICDRDIEYYAKSMRRVALYNGLSDAHSAALLTAVDVGLEGVAGDVDCEDYSKGDALVGRVFLEFVRRTGVFPGHYWRARAAERGWQRVRELVAARGVAFFWLKLSEEHRSRPEGPLTLLAHASAASNELLAKAARRIAEAEQFERLVKRRLGAEEVEALLAEAQAAAEARLA